MKNPYKDIINLPNHKSKKHPQMPRYNRAAQFSPFMALTGYESVISETGRFTMEKIQLDRDMKRQLDERLSIIRKYIDEKPEVKITYFQEDKKKSGGSYITISGYVKNIDEYRDLLIMENKREISIKDIVEIKGDLFDNLIYP